MQMEMRQNWPFPINVRSGFHNNVESTKLSLITEQADYAVFQKQKLAQQ